MKIIHLSDLHIGKRVCDCSLIEDQEFILNSILEIIREESPDAVIIAGDVYDKPIPTAEAIRLLDNFIFALSEMDLHTFIISGNHDSPERLSFGNRIMSSSGIHISSVYNGETLPITLHDDYGEVDFYLLPFIKPAMVRRFFDTELTDYNSAVKAAVGRMKIDSSKRNVIVTHQFVTGSICDSEELSVGGTENVDSEVFDEFDYVALGHIHRPQNVGDKKIRYCGTPLKYSISEIGQKKSLTVVELREKGELSVQTIPLKPMREMREYKMPFTELTAKSFYDTIDTNDYIVATLTDEIDIPDAVKTLQQIFPNLVKMRYDNSRTNNISVIHAENSTEKLPPEVLFEKFYEQQNNHSMTDEQREFINKIVQEIWGEILL